MKIRKMTFELLESHKVTDDYPIFVSSYFALGEHKFYVHHPGEMALDDVVDILLLMKHMRLMHCETSGVRAGRAAYGVCVCPQDESGGVKYHVSFLREDCDLPFVSRYVFEYVKGQEPQIKRSWTKCF